MIDRDSWTDAVASGWRLYENCSPDTESNTLRVAAAVKEFGSKDVSVGFAFGVTTPTVASERNGLAIYVRDGERFHAELREDMLNFDNGHEMAV